MSFVIASLIFMVTGGILFITILKIRRVHFTIGLLLVTASVLWSVLSLKYWVTTFPINLGWTGTLVVVIGILASMTILGKATNAIPSRVIMIFFLIIPSPL